MKIAQDTNRHGVRSFTGWLGIVAVTAIVSVLVPARLTAMEPEQHAEEQEQNETTGEEYEGAKAHGEEHHHKHHMALFIGATEGEEHHGEKTDPDFTLGFDYERRLSPLFGFGGMLDWVAEGNREVLIGPIGFLHPYKGSKLYAAPCYQRVREGGQDDFVFRVGAAWDFEIGKYSIGLHAIYDFAEEQDFLIVGMGFGMGF